ncbi:MAG: hypothetical protein PHG02_05160 [Oscillospiraceae bacterium]|nr:hypothetical protein [Oscillospiraceae bacterium]
MNFFERKSTARIFLIICVFLSLLLGCGASFSRMAGKVEKAYAKGEDGSGYCIASDIDSLYEISGNINKIAKKYFDVSDSYVSALQLARGQLKDASSIAEKKQAKLIVDSAVEAFYPVLQVTAMSETDAKYVTRLYYDYREANDKISHDSYNSLAAAYNAKLNVFPANILHKLVFASPFVTFDK